MKFAEENETPLVSVCLITYNHERWIADAIESVLMQETDFPCEFIIADDCSPDKTREIIQSYVEKYPLRLILQQPNKGAAGNFRDLIEAAQGKYIAYLEGDDRWENPRKLQMQADLLDSDPTVSMCYANARVYDTENPDAVIYFTDQTKPARRMDKYALLTHCVIPSVTMFFRNIVKQIPEWYYQIKCGDYYLVYLLSKYGDACYQDEIFGLYNHHYRGISAANHIGRWVYGDTVLSHNLISYFDGDKKIKDIIIGMHVGAIDYIFHRRAFWLAVKLFWQLHFGRLICTPRHYKHVAKLGIKVHFLQILSKNKKTAV